MKVPTFSIFTWVLLVCILSAGTVAGILFVRDPLHRSTSPSDRTLADYYAAAQQLAERSTAPKTTTVTFLAVGDISLSRNIAAVIQKKADPLYPFRGIETLLKSTDFNFGNLETPFSSNDRFTASNTLVFNAPKANVAGLKEYNFKVLTLANNHAFDQGLDGVRTTRQILADNNILFTGTGESLDEAWTPALYKVNGITIGFIGASYSSYNDGGKATNPYVARIDDVPNLQLAMSSLQSHGVDFVVVTMHAGVEYTAKPTQAQIDFAHAAIDAGADMVIGHHAHWVQEKELYCPGQQPTRQLPATSGEIITGPLEDLSAINSRIGSCKWIYYGLGNFIFDQSWSDQTKRGLALKITLTKTVLPTPSGKSGATIADLQPAGPRTGTQLESIQEIPTYIENNCCPVPAPTPTP